MYGQQVNKHLCCWYFFIEKVQLSSQSEKTCLSRRQESSHLCFFLLKNSVKQWVCMQKGFSLPSHYEQKQFSPSNQWNCSIWYDLPWRLCCVVFLFSVAHNTRLCIASILSCFSCVFSQKNTEIKDSELGNYNVEDGVMVCEVNTCSRKRKKKPTKRQLSKRVHHMPTGCGCFVPCSCKHTHKKFSCTEILLQNVKALR